ncbi:MAG: IclR family transcriptional regulator [Frankia sp.]|nr:IclR family transcriptional regulator [Frankia sp.]
MDNPLRTPPTYIVGSVDHALRLATMLQLEGRLTVAEAAERLGVARSTAHRLLQTLVYRDFAVQDAQRVYHAGPVIELAAHSHSETARLRSVSLPHLERLVALVRESANVAIRTGGTVRFIASVESEQALRVTSREGMVFPAQRTTAGMLLLAEFSADDLESVYADTEDAPDLGRLRAELARIRRSGFALNQGRSERGVVAVGVPIRDGAGAAVAGLSVSMPSVRYERERLPKLVATLHRTAGGIEADLAS